jgi:hypothetical protein
MLASPWDANLIFKQPIFDNPTELASVDLGFCTSRYFTRNYGLRSAEARKPLRQAQWGCSEQAYGTDVLSRNEWTMVICRICLV